ncbi:hypothetical protein Tco_1046868 [Tanacetum coccineum]
MEALQKTIMPPICFRFEYIMVENFKVIRAECYTNEPEPLFYNYLRPLTSLDEGLYALACEEDVRCLDTLVRSFKLIDFYIEHGVTALDCYIRPPQFRGTIEYISDEPGSIATNRTEKMLLLTWHESSEPTKEPVCDSVTPSFLPQHDSSTPCKVSVCDSITPRCMPYCMLTPPTDKSVITYTQLSGVIDVMRPLSFEETILNGKAGFADVARSGVESFMLSHDESFGVDDLDLNLNKPVPIVEEVGTQEFTMEDVVLEDYVSYGEDVEQCNGQEDESAPNDGHFFCDDEGIDTAYETKYDVQSSEHAVADDVLEGEDMGVINPDGFDSNSSNDDETNDYRRRRRNLKLYKNDSVRIRARCDGKVSVFTMSQGTRPTGPNCGKKLGLMDKVAQIFDQVRVNPDIRIKAVQDHLQRELEVQISMSKAFRAKAKAEREIRGDHVLQYSMLRDYVVEEFQRIYVCLGALKLGFRACKRDLLGLDGAFMKGSFPRTVLTSIQGFLWRAASATSVKELEKCGNNEEASGSASRQAQQTKPTVGQDGLGGSGVGVVIGLSTAGQGGPGGAGVGSQGSSYTRWTKEEYTQKELVHKKELLLSLQVNLLPVLKC